MILERLAVLEDTIAKGREELVRLLVPVTAISEIAVLLRNGTSVRQSAEMSGLPITRIETIADGRSTLRKLGSRISGSLIVPIGYCDMETFL